MRARKMFPAIFSVCLLLFTTVCPAQNPHLTPPAHPTAPMTDQDVLLLFAGRSANDKILLTLNNNRPGKLAVDLTLYDLGGNPKPLPALTMDSSESRLIVSVVRCDPSTSWPRSASSRSTTQGAAWNLVPN